MDARFIVNHIKNEEQSGLDGLCSSARYFSSAAAHQAESFPALNQKCLKRNYDQMNSPFTGLGQQPQQQQQQTMPNDTCFPNSLPQQQQQPAGLLYRPPYSIPFHHGSLVGPDLLLPHLVQEPKFPPQTFDIPDIHDLNSVFGGNGPFDSPPPPFGVGGGYAPPFLSSDRHRPPFGASFYVSSEDQHQHSQFRSSSSLGVPTAFQAWQSPGVGAGAGAGGVVSSTRSTNSSPVSQAEEAMPPSVAEAASSASIQPQQVQTAKSNSFTTQSQQSTISRLPNKKARSPKRRKRKDPNEPQKPVSAYSLFFRNAQAAIKSQNPSATFGDVSKIVASMWDGLDDDVKNFYKRQMEIAKKEYLKQLAIYRATLVSQEVQGKTGPDGETGIGALHSAPPLPLPPAPSALPAQSPSSSSSSSSQKVEDGLGLGLSPNPAPLCMSASGYPAQNPLSPAAEPVNHHLMSPQSAAGHPQTFPLFYSEGPPCLPMRYSSPSDITAMRNSFLTYSQKLDQDSVMSRISEPNSYFHGIGPESGFKTRAEYASLAGNSFVNGLRREIPGRPFAEPDENDQKLT